MSINGTMLLNYWLSIPPHRGRDQLENWKSLKIDGIGAIKKIIAYFEVSPSGKFPYNKIQIKIMETQSGSFIGIPNVAPKERQTFSPDWRAGFGRSVEDALENTLKVFLESVAEHEAFEDNEFEWADPLDF